MSLFDRIFGGRKKDEPQRMLPEYKALTAYQPVFTSFSGQLYETELIRSAINVRATHISKLKVDFYGHGAEALSKRLTRPNGFQTWSQFLYRVSTILDCNNGCIIAPVFDKFGRVTELYPVLPERTKMVDNGGYPWIAMKFRDGQYAQMPVWQVGLLTKFQYKDDFFGEKNGALIPTMKLIDIQEQGITEGVKSAAAIRFIAQMSNFAKAEDLAKEQRRFVANNLSGKENGGMLLFPNTFQNIKQVDSKPYVPDADQMKVINESVYRYFNVNEEVLRGEAFGDKWTAFYESAVEPFAIQFSEVMSIMLQLNGQLSGDSGVFATANRLQYMSNAEKLNVSSQLLDRGILSINDVREIWNLAPVEDGDRRIIRGEYYDTSEKLSEEDNNADQE